MDRDKEKGEQVDGESAWKEMATQKKAAGMSVVNEQWRLRVRAKKVRHGICTVGIIFPHTGSPTLRQMENRKGEQGEIQLSQVSSSGSVLIALYLCVHVCVCVSMWHVFSSVRSTSGAPSKWDRQLKD